LWFTEGAPPYILDFGPGNPNPALTITGAGGDGDGGNLQLYDDSTADIGTFHNYPGDVDVANGGVTSSNNNPSTWPPPDPPVLGPDEGATAGAGIYVNYAANRDGMGLGGHTEFTAKYGSPGGGTGHAHRPGRRQRG
jgi:hypothetical protein